jgi:hypothetical protein
MGPYAYQSLPIHYSARTQDDRNITCLIVDRGLGSIQTYNQKMSSYNNPRPCLNNIKLIPLPPPCPFEYWTPNKGKCGDNMSEPEIKAYLNEFSADLHAFYDIESIYDRMVITQLYSDCMCYETFRQEATVFKVNLIPKKNLPAKFSRCISLFYKQPITVVFVNYAVIQYTFFPDVKLIQCYHLDPQPLLGQDPLYVDIPGYPNLQGPRVFDINAPDFNVQGYYILTIIPTKVLIPERGPNPINCYFDNITKIALFEYFIKGGHFVCKSFDYIEQCKLETFPLHYPDKDPAVNINKIKPINLFYAFLGHRANALQIFQDLFGWTPEEKKILSIYSEQIITTPSTKGMVRTLTNAKSNAQKNDLLIKQINEECYDRLKQDLEKTINQKRLQQQQPPRISEKRKEGGTIKHRTNKNKKQYKNKLQTYKRKKCKQQKIKRKTKKNHKKRTTKKRSL